MTRALPISPPAASRCTIISSVTASPLETSPPGTGCALAPPASLALISRTACCTCAEVEGGVWRVWCGGCGVDVGRRWAGGGQEVSGEIRRDAGRW